MKFQSILFISVVVVLVALSSAPVTDGSPFVKEIAKLAEPYKKKPVKRNGFGFWKALKKTVEVLNKPIKAKPKA